MVRVKLIGRAFNGARGVEVQVEADLSEEILKSLQEFDKGIRDIYAWGYADEIFHCLGKLAGMSGGQYTGYELIR